MSNFARIKGRVDREGLLMNVRGIYNAVQTHSASDRLDEHARHKLAVQAVGNFLRTYFRTDSITDAAVDSFIAEVGV